MHNSLFCNLLLTAWHSERRHRHKHTHTAQPNGSVCLRVACLHRCCALARCAEETRRNEKGSRQTIKQRKERDAAACASPTPIFPPVSPALSLLVAIAPFFLVRAPFCRTLAIPFGSPSSVCPAFRPLFYLFYFPTCSPPWSCSSSSPFSVSRRHFSPSFFFKAYVVFVSLLLVCVLFADSRTDRVARGASGAGVAWRRASVQGGAMGATSFLVFLLCFPTCSPDHPQACLPCNT